jgi:hypothetical protein
VQALREGQEKIRRGGTVDWESDLRERLVKHFEKAGHDGAQAGELANRALAGFRTNLDLAAKVGAAYVRSLGATIDMLDKQTQSLNAVNQVMNAQMETTKSMIDAGSQFATNMILMFMPGGIVAKGIATAVVALVSFFWKSKTELDTKLANSARDFAQKTLEVYSSLGQAGVMAGKGLEDVGRIGESFRLTAAQMGPLADAIKGSASELALLGGGMRGGLKAMSRLGEVSKTNEIALYNMGIQLKDVPEYTASFMRSMAYSGKSQKDVANMGSEAMMEYIIETQKITALTGASRREQEESRKAWQQQKATAAALELMDEKQADQVKGFIENMNNLGPEFNSLAQGFAALTTGTLQSEDSIKILQTFGPVLQKQLGMDAGQFMEMVKSGTKEDQNRYADMIIKMMNDPENRRAILEMQRVGNSFGQDVSAFTKARQLQNRDLDKEGKEIRKGYKDQADGMDATTKAASKILKEQQDNNIKYADVMQKMMIPALEEGAKTMKKLADEAEAAAIALGYISGKKQQATTEPKEAEVAGAATDRMQQEKKKTQDAEKSLTDLRRRQARGEQGLDDQIKKQEEAVKTQIELQKEAEKDARVKANEAQQASQKQYWHQKTQRELEKQIKKANDDGDRWDKLGNEARAKSAWGRAKLLEEKLKKVQGEASAPGGATSAPGGATSAPGGATSAPGGATSAPGTAPASGVPARPDETQPKKSATTEMPKNVTVQSTAQLSGVNQDLLSRFTAFAEEWGKPISINSGYRGNEKQAELWVRANKFQEYGIFSPSLPELETKITYRGQEFVVPGSGRKHSHMGQALDIEAEGVGKQQTAIDQILAKHGLRRPFLSFDPPHVQVSAADGAVLTGPQSGYQPSVTMHGTEAIVPLKNLSVPVQITADSTIGQTMVTLNGLMEQLLEHAQAHGDLLQRIADSSKNTASATEKSARYAQN